MSNESFYAGQWALSIDGVIIGFCKSVTGGKISAKTASHASGPDIWTRKHVVGVEHDPFTIEVSFSMGKGLWEWLAAALSQSHVRRSGEILSLDFDGKEKRVMEFREASIVGFTLPALDGSSREPAYIKLEIEPTTSRHRKGSDAKVVGNFAKEHKKWLACNWRLAMGDWDCKRVSKISEVKVTIASVKDELGAFLEPTKHPGKTNVDDVTLTMSMADAEQLDRTFQKTVIEGVNGIESEMQGSIELLSPDLKDTLATINLINCGMLSLEHESLEANKDQIARCTTSLYVEELGIDIQPSAAGA